MFGGHFGVAEAFITVVILGMCILFPRFWWGVFSKRPFPWKKFLIGFGVFWVIIFILSLLGVI